MSEAPPPAPDALGRLNISAPFIDRPIATSLLAIAVLLAGLLGYLRLPVSALPEVDFPTIEVTTTLPGAAPETVALLITASLERQLAQIAGLTDLISASGPGVSRITLQFTLGRDIDDAAQDVQAAINAARGTLPQNLPYPPTYAKVNPADPPILTLALTSPGLPQWRLADAADTLLAPRLAQVSGVGRVVVQGGMRPAVRVQADPRRLASFGLSLEDVRTAIQAGNVNTPKGSVDGPRQASTVMANDQITRPEDFAGLIIAWRNGAPVRLRDVGEAVLDLENSLVGAWVDGRPAVLLDVQRQPGANIVATVEALKEELPALERALPEGATLRIIADRTITIRASVRDVQFTLALAIGLVVGVIFVFLRSARATLIPGAALPLSILGTFGVMALAGFSLDNLSLMALTIATGFVVDDAIVMIENIVRLIEEGKSPGAAAREGAAQIGFTIVSLTVSLVAVFIPLLFMPGVVGRLFSEFALTLTVAVLVSMFVSLTLTPMMCATLLRPREEARPGALSRATERLLDGVKDAYARSLAVSLRHQGAMLGLAVLTLLGTVWLYLTMPKGFLPVQDTGLIMAVLEGPEDASFARMAKLQAEVAAALKTETEVAAVTSVIGAGIVNPAPNTGRLLLVLTPREGRTADAEAIARRLRARLAALPGLRLHLQPVQDIQIGTRQGAGAYQYTLMAPDAAELAHWTPLLEARLAALPIFADVVTDRRDGGLRVTVDVDRDLAGRLGVTMQAVDDVLYNAFGQRQISTIYAQNNQYRVVLEASPELRDDPAMIGLLRVPATAGQAATAQGTPVQTASGTPQVPLAQIARIGRAAGPLTVTKQAQFPAVTLGFDLAPGVSLGEAVAAIHGAEAALGMPDSIIGAFAGDAAEFQRSLRGEPWLILAALVVIYITLGVLYESLIHPITILSTLPSAGIGALLALRFCGLDLSVLGLIGIVLLMGIVKKNAIMMIDFALAAQRDEGMAPRDAIERAAVLRFRPIMMTTLAALLGALPLVLEAGTGSELRFPLGVSVIGGLLLSQAITLYTTPAIYLAFERLRLAWRPARPKPA